MKRLPFLFLALAASGCETTLLPMTDAPPAKIAEIDEAYGRIEISAGVAMAFECRYDGSPCQDATAVMVDPNIADVYPTAFAASDPNAQVFLIIGRKPGTTSLRVAGYYGNASYTVTVSE